MLLEYRSSMKIRKLYHSNVFHEVAPVDEDLDVVNERQRVMADTDDVIRVIGMRKEYPDGKDVKVNDNKQYKNRIIKMGIRQSLGMDQLQSIHYLMFY